MVFQAIPLFLSLRNQVTSILGNPLRLVKTVQEKEVGSDAPLLMATYTDAVNKFAKAATEIMEYARLLTEARNAYLLRQKESDLVRLRREIDSLKLVIPLLVEDSLEIQMVEDGSPKANHGTGFDSVHAGMSP
jgi:hypothetical protein